ncbi:hypothetical protein BX666DRAFT_2019122 [Dichotomocladium elegans]|nr:hypothetical protein BX666DRAFT_2019122 [Dichotomocladium elegans]
MFQSADSKSFFIIDPTDPVWQSVFSISELKEISELHAHTLPPVSDTLLEYLNSFTNLTNIRDLDEHCRSRTFSFEEEYDLDWSQMSIDSALRLYKSKYLPLTTHTEVDVIRRIWFFVDTAFDNLDIDVRTGEMESVASSTRRNMQDQDIKRKLHGHRADFLLIADHLELGCAEIGKIDGGDADRKEMNEKGLKCPKMMKDMLWLMAKEYEDKSRHLVTVGFIMMGLKLRVLFLDNPSTYICRLNSTDAFYFPTKPEDFGMKFGKLLVVRLMNRKQLETRRSDLQAFPEDSNPAQNRLHDKQSVSVA